MSTTSPIHAALVLGSDSFRLLVAGWRDGRLDTLEAAHVPLRLAAALDARNCLSTDALQSALDCVQRMRERLDAWPLAAVRVVATSTLRMASNSQVFLSAAQQLLGYPIDVLSGEREGILTWLGATGGAAQERALVLGIGGGSTQFVLGTGARILRAHSLALGTARVALTFFGNGRIDGAAFGAAVGSCRAKIADEAAAYGARQRSQAFGASGTIRTLARLQAQNGIPGPFAPTALDALRARVLEHGAGAAPLHGLGALRLRDVAAALAIAQALMEELEIGALELPDEGLRAGLLAELRHGPPALAA